MFICLYVAFARSQAIPAIEGAPHTPIQGRYSETSHPRAPRFGILDTLRVNSFSSSAKNTVVYSGDRIPLLGVSILLPRV